MLEDQGDFVRRLGFMASLPGFGMTLEICAKLLVSSILLHYP